MERQTSFGTGQWKRQGKTCAQGHCPAQQKQQLLKSEENLKWTFTTRKFQTSTRLQNKTKHLLQEQTPNLTITLKTQ